jgi:hypothetical protein
MLDSCAFDIAVESWCVDFFIVCTLQIIFILVISINISIGIIIIVIIFFLENLLLKYRFCPL